MHVCEFGGNIDVLLLNTKRKMTKRCQANNQPITPIYSLWKFCPQGTALSSHTTVQIAFIKIQPHLQCRKLKGLKFLK